MIAADVVLRVVDTAELAVVVHFLRHQGVGIVVGSHADDGIIGDACFFQALHQVAQGVLHLQVGGDIALHRLGGVGIGGDRLFTVLGGHGVAPAPVGVSADGHIVGVEGRAVLHIGGDVIVNGVHHHLLIGVGPVAAAGDKEAVAYAVEVVAQVGMGEMTVIVGVGVVVIRQRVISQGAELVTQCKGHIVTVGDVEAEVIVDPSGDKARHHGKFAAGGGLTPAGLIKVVEHEALMGEAIEGGRQLLTDDIGREGLGGNEDEIFPLKEARIVVLLGGSLAAEVAVEGDGGGGRPLIQGGKVDVHLVVLVLLQRGVVYRLNIDALGNVIQRRFGDAKDGVLHLKADSARQTHHGNGAVGGIVVGVGILISAIETQHRAKNLRQHQKHQQEDARLFTKALLGQEMAAEENEADEGNEGKTNKGQAVKDHLHGGGGEVGHDLPCHVGHVAKAEVGLKIALAAVFHAHKHRPCKARHIAQHSAELIGAHKMQQQRYTCAEDDGEEGRIQQRDAEKRYGIVKQTQQRLVIEQRNSEKAEGQPLLGRARRFQMGRLCLVHW